MTSKGTCTVIWRLCDEEDEVAHLDCHFQDEEEIDRLIAELACKRLDLGGSHYEREVYIDWTMDGTVLIENNTSSLTVVGIEIEEGETA